MPSICPQNSFESAQAGKPHKFKLPFRVLSRQRAGESHWAGLAAPAEPA